MRPVVHSAVRSAGAAPRLDVRRQPAAIEGSSRLGPGSTGTSKPARAHELGHARFRSERSPRSMSPLPAARRAEGDAPNARRHALRHRRPHPRAVRRGRASTHHGIQE